MWAPMGKLVPQLPWFITFAYNLCFRCTIARWKGLSKDYTFVVVSSKKSCLGPQNSPTSQGPKN